MLKCEFYSFIFRIDIKKQFVTARQNLNTDKVTDIEKSIFSNSFLLSSMNTCKTRFLLNVSASDLVNCIKVLINLYKNQSLLSLRKVNKENYTNRYLQAFFYFV